jgi:hypothetical protein
MWASESQPLRFIFGEATLGAELYDRAALAARARVILRTGASAN